MLQIQLRQLAHTGQGLQIADGIVAGVQNFQGSGLFQTGQGAEAAIGDVQLCQLGELRNGGQAFRGKAAAGEIQLFQMGQALEILEVAHVSAADCQAFQIGQVAQVLQSGCLRGNLQLRDLPQVVGVEHMVRVVAEGGADGLLHGGIHKEGGFNHAANGIAENGYGAYKPVVPNADGVNLGFTQGQFNGRTVGCIGNGGVISVCGIVEGTLRRGEGHADILAVVAGGVVRLGGGGPHGLQFRLDGGVRNVCQHGDGVQQLVLLYVGFAQCRIELLGCTVPDGLGERHLGLGVVAGGLVLVGKLNGHVFILPGEAVGHVIEPGGQAGVAFQVVVSRLLQQDIPGEGPVVYKQIPADAGNYQNYQQQRHQKVDQLFHNKSSNLRDSSRQLYNIFENMSSMPHIPHDDCNCRAFPGKNRLFIAFSPASCSG